MKTERFERAIAALVKGFFNGTLVKGHCAACAVGNIVAAGIGCEVEISKNAINTDWMNVFVTLHGDGQILHPKDYFGNAKRLIDSTFYSWQELARVENAFEKATVIHVDDYKKHTADEILNDQYRGLMAVVDVLCDIEGLQVQETKELFSYTVKDSEPVHA